MTSLKHLKFIWFLRIQFETEGLWSCWFDFQFCSTWEKICLNFWVTCCSLCLFVCDIIYHQTIWNPSHQPTMEATNQPPETRFSWGRLGGGSLGRRFSPHEGLLLCSGAFPHLFGRWFKHRQLMVYWVYWCLFDAFDYYLKVFFFLGGMMANHRKTEINSNHHKLASPGFFQIEASLQLKGLTMG